MQEILKNKKPIYKFVITILSIALVYLIYPYFANVIAPFIYGLALAYILEPAIRGLERRRIKRVWAILIIFAVFLGLLIVFVGTFIPRLSEDIGMLLRELPALTKNLIEITEKIKTGEMIPFIENMGEFIDIDQEIQLLNKSIGNILKGVINRVVKSSGTLIDIIMTPVIAFYLLKDKEILIQKIKGAIPKKYKKKTHELYLDLDRSFGGFIKGQLIVAIFIGTLTGVGCYLIGIPYALTVGVIAGITNIIPYFGPFLGGVLPVLLGLINNPMDALWVVLLMLVVQQVESAFLSPQIMSHSVGIHPLLVMFSVLFFGNALGIIGMIIGVPLMAGMIIISKHLLANIRNPQ